MDLYAFESEEAVEREAERITAKLFADKSYSNPQKLSLLLADYEKKQLKLDAQLSKTIKAEIECIKQAKQAVLEANDYMKKADERTEMMGEIWKRQEPFHEYMEDVLALEVFQGNVGKVVEQLSYFIDMEAEMQQLQKWAEDETKHLSIAKKLASLLQLRDALLQDSSWQREAAIMRKEFVKVTNFETKFFDRVFDCFNDCIQLGKDRPESLKTAVQVVECFDASLVQRGKERAMRPRVEEALTEAIEMRFDRELSDAEELFEIIEKAKFATKDLVDVNDYVVPCFPKDFPILELFQGQYQEKIESIIFPYFQQIEENCEYQLLIGLFGWIVDYETMLARSGLESNSLGNLKAKASTLMPFFIEKNRKLIREIIDNSIEDDKKMFSRKYYEELIQSGQDFVSDFPFQIFLMINSEAEIINDRLSGQIFIDFVRCITTELQAFQDREVAELQREWKEVIQPSRDENELVNFEYKLFLYINNFNACLKNAGESKEEFGKYVGEELKSRVERLFFGEVQKAFYQSVPLLIDIVIQIIFTNVTAEYYPNLFTKEWVKEKSGATMNKILGTINNELTDIEEQSLIINIIQYRMLVRDTLETIVNAYVEQLIVFAKILYKADGHMEVKYCNQRVTNKRIVSDMTTDMREVFNSRVAFTDTIKKDRLAFLKFADSYSECTSKVLMDKLKVKFSIIIELFMKKNKEFDALPTKLAELYPEKASQLLEVVLIVRDDVESRASSIPKRGMGHEQG